jgi:lipooligosaccharide transport system permease protein
MRRSIRVWQRNLKVWSKYCWVSLVSNLGEPILYILAIGLGLGKYVGTIEGVDYIVFLGPAILVSAVMNSASFETTFSSYTRMSVQKTFDAIIVTPVSIQEVIAGEIFWGATKAFLTGMSMYGVLLVFNVIPNPWTSVALIPVIILTGLLFASFGILVTSFARSYDFFAYYFTLILGPMFFFSGTFFPLSQLPPWVAQFAWFMPLTHSVSLSRSIALGQFSMSLWADFLWLSVVMILIFWAGIYRMSRRLVY